MPAAYRRQLRWILGAWVTCLVILSLQPLRVHAARGGTLTHLALHILAFGFPTWLLQRLSARRTGAWLAVLCALCLAAGIESAQHLIYRNPFEWQDLSADLLGAVIAILPRLLTGDRRGCDST